MSGDVRPGNAKTYRPVGGFRSALLRSEKASRYVELPKLLAVAGGSTPPLPSISRIATLIVCPLGIAAIRNDCDARNTGSVRHHHWRGKSPAPNRPKLF